MMKDYHLQDENSTFKVEL